MLKFQNMYFCSSNVINYQSKSKINMLRRFKNNSQKTWLKFSVKHKNGDSTNYQVIDLSKDLVEDYVKFHMKHFVLRETIHLASGIWKNAEAMDEYSNFMKYICVNTPYHSIVCCPEVDGQILPEIVGTSAVKIIKTDTTYGWEYPEAKTEELKRLFNLLRDWNTLYPISDVMEKYGAKMTFEHESIAVSSDYSKSGIGRQLTSLTKDFCRTYNVPIAVGWMTSEASRKVFAVNGWKTVYKIKKDDISKKLNVSFEDVPSKSPFVHFMIYKHSN